MSGPCSTALAPGWRCSACGYSLDGLPDHAEETQRPECGHTGSPDKSVAGEPQPEVPATVAVGFATAGVITLLSGFVASEFLVNAWYSRRYGHPDVAAIDLSIAIGLAYVSVAVWFVPRRQFPLIRWVGALAGVALVAWCIGELREEWHAILVAPLFYGTVISLLLPCPEMASLLRHVRGRSSR